MPTVRTRTVSVPARNYSLPCRGWSMRGTIEKGDCLWVSAVPFDSLQVGDVVAFACGCKVITHRIVGREENGFVTQGDGSLQRDGECLTPGRLIGRVMGRERAGKRSPVMGGIRGRRRGAIMRAANRVRSFVGHALAMPYRLTRTSQLVPLLWRPRMTVVHFAGSQGKSTKFIHRGKTVACWVPNERRWTCRKPYDLILAPPSK